MNKKTGNDTTEKDLSGVGHLVGRHWGTTE